MELLKEKKLDLDDSNYLPLGQKLLNCGFKKVTLLEIQKRLCDKINEKLIDDAEKNMKELIKNKLFKKYKIKLEHFIIPYHQLGIQFNEIIIRYGFLKLNKKKIKACNMKSEKLENYIDEKIPDRCIKIINKAKECGIENFMVHYPVIEEIKQYDPIITARLGPYLIEIAQWV